MASCAQQLQDGKVGAWRRRESPGKKESILWIGGGVCSTVRAGGKESWSFGHTRAVYTAKARGYVFHSLGTRVCPVVGSLRKAGMERVVW